MSGSRVSTDSAKRQSDRLYKALQAESDDPVPWQGIVKGAGMLIASNFAEQIAVAIAGLLIIRSTDQTGYGYYATAYAFATAFVGLFLMGIEGIVTREVARNPVSASSVMPTALAMVFTWSPLAVGITWRIAALLHYPQETVILLRVITLTLLIKSLINLFRAVLRGLGRMDLDSLTRVAESVAGLVFVLIALYTFGSVLSATTAILLATVLTFAGSILLVRSFVQPPYSCSGSLVMKLLKAAIPIGIALTTQGLYWRLDALVLSVLRSVEEVGLYVVAANTAMLSRGVSLAIISSVFPSLSALSHRESAHFKELLEGGLRYVLILSLPIGVMTSVLASPIITILYGVEFAAATSALGVLGFMIPLMFISTYLWGTLISIGKQNLLISSVLVSLLTMFTLCVVLVPQLGIVGSALAALAREGCAVILMGYHVRRQVGSIQITKVIVSPLIATTVLAVCVWILKSYTSFWLLVPVAVVIYVVGLVITGGIRPSELSWGMSVFSRVRSRICVPR